jgi:hypothetical protein
MSATRTPHHRRKTKIHRRPKKGPESINWNNIKGGLSLSLSSMLLPMLLPMLLCVFAFQNGRDTTAGAKKSKKNSKR